LLLVLAARKKLSECTYLPWLLASSGVVALEFRRCSFEEAKATVVVVAWR
jgi:hypothetical protein